MSINENCIVKIHYNKLWLMPASRRELFAITKAMLKAAPHKIGSLLHINIVDDATIAEINKDYLYCHGPTNILSFPAENTQNSDPNDSIANIFLSIDTLHRECFLYKQSPQLHLLWLLAHAMGHLCNMDHSPEMDLVCSNLYAAAYDIL